MAKQDRVVAGVRLPGGEEPPTTEFRMTPLSPEFLKTHQNAQQLVPVPCSTSAGTNAGILMSGLPRAVPGSCLSLLGAPGMEEWSDQLIAHRALRVG